MRFKSIFLLVIACGVIGYVIEPLLFSRPETASEDNKEGFISKNPSEEAATSSFSYIGSEKKSEEQARIAALREQEARLAAEAAAARAKAIAEQEEKNQLVDLTPDVPAKKPPFPIVSLQLNRYDKNSSTGSPNLEKAIQFALKNNHFEGLVTLLEKDLYHPVSRSKEIAVKDLKSISDNPAWNHSLNVYTMLQRFSPDELGHATTASSEASAFYYWMFTTPEALTQFLYNFTPQDDLNKALIIWQNIWVNENTADMRIKYLNLAIACALVYDKGNIKAKTGYGSIEPLSRYTLFRKNAEAHRLKTTLSKLKVADLVWVVDVPISDAEIEWALRHANFSRRNWGKAYEHIEYLMERAVNGENPYKEYTFAQIQKHGGICGDQTYFSVNTAKANGIPAAGVTGSGDRGGHAWLAYKPNDDEWDTTTGRYENYSNGNSRNSQINQGISEFDFMLMSDRKMKAARVQEAKTLLRLVPILVSIKHDPIGIRQTLEEAIDIAPLLEDAWTDYVNFLENTDPAPTKDDWQKIINTIERTFKKHPTMWMTARSLTQKHIWKDLEPKHIEKTQSRYRSEIARKFPARGDLIRKVIAEQGDMVVKQNDFAATRSFYRQAFRLFGEDTLNFKFIANRYFQCGKQYPDDREQICDDIERYFSQSIDQESGDFFKAKTEIGILKTISGYYRQIGNERKADKYSKEAKARAKKSGKRAL